MINLNDIKKKSKSTTYIGARVPDELKARLDLFCQANGVKASGVIQALVEGYLDLKETKLYRVNCAHMEDAILTADAYEVLRLSLSTGDFHMHTAELISDPTEDDLAAALEWDEEEQAFV